MRAPPLQPDTAGWHPMTMMSMSMSMAPMPYAPAGHLSPQELMCSLNMNALNMPMGMGMYPQAGMPGPWHNLQLGAASFPQMHKMYPAFPGMPAAQENYDAPSSDDDDQGPPMNTGLSRHNLQLRAASFPPMHMGMYPGFPGMPAAQENCDAPSSDDEGSDQDSPRISESGESGRTTGRSGISDEGGSIDFKNSCASISTSAYSRPLLYVPRERELDRRSISPSRDVASEAAATAKKRAYSDIGDALEMANLTADSHAISRVSAPSEKAPKTARCAVAVRHQVSNRSPSWKGAVVEADETILDASHLLLNFAMTNSTSTTSVTATATADQNASDNSAVSFKGNQSWRMLGNHVVSLHNP
jgi:hypothetical protein